MSDPVLKLSGITKRFGQVLANDDVSFDLNPGEIIALLGENGAGKTTLMSILFGHYLADEGTIEINGRPLAQGSPKAALNAGVGMVHQHFTLAGNMSVLDNIILGTEPVWTLKSHRKNARKKLTRLMDRFGLVIDPDARVKHLSVGEQQRVEILKVLFRDAKILILDEPTAVLTPQESDHLFVTLNQMVNQGMSIIFITHKMREVMQVSRRCIVLRQGKIVFQADTCHTSPEQLARAMVGEEIQRPARQRLIPGNEALSLDEIFLKPRGETIGLKNLSLSLKACEILGIAGVSGNGQSQLADLISGLETPDKGKIYIHSKPVEHPSPRTMVKSGLGRVPDDRTGTGLIAEMSVMENMTSQTYRDNAYSRGGMLRFKAMAEHTRKQIKKFNVRCPHIHTPVRNLSGGNMQKLILAREFSSNPRIILANQPTWGLDVGATAYVHSQLMAAAQKGAAIIIISEDLDELFLVADRIQVMAQGRLSSSMDVDEVDRNELGLIMAGQQTRGEKNAD
ncbi:MAG: ABC transporter ATP-binding protein [Desulfobacter sp.]|nr:ABC transporter ATP-binding protein [Desulfobacter sp.]WDP85166.1 MAG: ABC transporter ATP-binding protein [Desulfobacter sp.]